MKIKKNSFKAHVRDVFILVITFFYSNLATAQDCQLNIGVILPLSGNAAEFGVKAKSGIGTALGLFDKKQNGESKSCSIKLYYEDSQWETAKGITAFRSLLSKYRIDAIITASSQVSLGVEPLAKQKNIPQFAIFSSTESYSSPNDLSFRLCPRAQDDLRPYNDWITKNKSKRFGILFIENEFGVGLQKEFKKVLNKNSINTKIELSFLPTETDFRTILLKFKQNQIDVVFLAGLPNHYDQILRQSKELNFDPYFLSNRVAQDQNFLSKKDLLNKFIYTHTFDESFSNQKAEEFISTYLKLYGKSPDSFTADGYESINILIEILSACVNDDSGISTSCILRQMLREKGFDTVFGNLKFDINGDTMFQETLAGAIN